MDCQARKCRTAGGRRSCGRALRLRRGIA